MRYLKYTLLLIGLLISGNAMAGASVDEAIQAEELEQQRQQQIQAEAQAEMARQMKAELEAMLAEEAAATTTAQ